MTVDWQKAATVAGVAGASLVVLHLLRRQGGAEGGAEKRSKALHAEGVDAEAVKALAEKAVAQYVKEVGPRLQAGALEQDIIKAGDLGKYIAFKQEYHTQLLARPDVGEGQLLRVTDWRRLTPEDYDRTTFHIEVDVAGTSLEKLVNGADGKALSVYSTNDPALVTEFIKTMGLNPFEVVSCEEVAPQDEEGAVVLTTLEKLFRQYLDLFGKPTREFLKKLVPYVVDIVEKVTLAELTLDRKADEFTDRQARAYTYADYLTEFKSLKIPSDKFVELIPTIKQRVYSICSSTAMRPGKCQLLVVREDWQAKGGATKFGLCSSYMTFLRPGDFCVGHSTHSVMKIPDDKSVHLFMAGLGTGLAPFRAFVEERKSQKDAGHKVGPMTLFFGGRHSKTEYYYNDEFEAYEKEGLLKCCNAWSRDQATKVYVQHKIKEEEDAIWEQLGKPGSRGFFFLCGSKQPEKDVYRTLLGIMQDKGNMTQSQAQAKMEELQAAGRYVTEVY